MVESEGGREGERGEREGGRERGGEGREKGWGERETSGAFILLCIFLILVT